jgi:hypothetical protein
VLLTGASSLLTLHSLPGVLVGAALVGTSMPPIVVGLYTLAQRRTPMELQGRVYSAFDVMIGVPQMVSIAAGAWLVAIIDYRLLLVVAALLSGFAAVYLLTRQEQWHRGHDDVVQPSGPSGVRLHLRDEPRRD